MSWEWEKTGVSCTQLPKTLQSEYLILPVNYTVEMGISSLLAS